MENDQGYAYDPETEEYAHHINVLRVYDRARVSLLRRALSDLRLKARARLTLFAIAARCDALTHSATIPTIDLETDTDLPMLSVAKVVADLRACGYIMTGPGKMFWILPIRVVEGGE